jgi:6,7-dimethyl-8-ribityllumazine synthase
MPETIDLSSGTLESPSGAFAIVVSRFNDLITGNLLAGALHAFEAKGVRADRRVRVIWVPGGFELPLAAQRAAASGYYKAVVALGCVIRGDTPHFDYVAGEASRGLMAAQLRTGIPIAFGLITTDTLEQAVCRSSIESDVLDAAVRGPVAHDAASSLPELLRTHSNKGAESVMAALEMAAVMDAMSAVTPRSAGF